MKKILQKERIEKILKLFDKNTYISYSFLEENMEVSSATIRRDVNLMESLGLINKIAGGIELRINDKDIDYSLRLTKNLSQKKKIAKKASKYLKKDEIIFLDSGTTILELIPYLKNMNITVITNCVSHLEKLYSLGIKNIIIGGNFKHKTKAIVGSIALESLNNYYFDKSFLGTNGIDENGYTTPDIEEALIKKKVIQKSKTSIILADTSKINKISNVNFANINDCILITEKEEE